MTVLGRYEIHWGPIIGTLIVLSPVILALIFLGGTIYHFEVKQPRALEGKIAWLHAQGCVLREVEALDYWSLDGGGSSTFDCNGVIRHFGGDVTQAWDGGAP